VQQLLQAMVQHEGWWCTSQGASPHCSRWATEPESWFNVQQTLHSVWRQQWHAHWTL